MVLLLLWITLIAMLPGCGGGGSPTHPTQAGGPISGNWQFQIVSADGSFSSSQQNCGAPPKNSTALCVGGFLQQSNGSVIGQLAYSIVTPTTTPGTYCNSGVATVTGTVSGQTVNLTAVAGNQSFVLAGTVSSDGSTMTGTYNSSGQSCGNAQSGASWSAISVPALTGAVQGSFHSTQQSGIPALVNQDYSVTGTFTQGPNIGASSATLTGTLNFQNYPCATTASLNGEISGNSVILDIIAQNGLKIGQIGFLPGSPNAPVVFQSSAAGGNILLGANGYNLSTKQCSGASGGDAGNICLALGNAKACTQSITLSPGAIVFPPQSLGVSSSQSISVTNTDPSGSTLSNLQISVQALAGGSVGDFTGLPIFTEQDNCASGPGSTFSLGPQQSCKITMIFSPQQSCPWVPATAGGTTVPSQCPPFLPITVPSPPELLEAVNVTVGAGSSSADADNTFSVPISALGISVLQPSTPELDFGAEALGEQSLPQIVSFRNPSGTPIQILPPSNACGANNFILPRPVVPGSASGLQVVQGASIFSFNTTVGYRCDKDTTTNQPNFQISNDSCSGALLMPLQSCSLSITYVPQSGTPQNPPLDYFLELNTNRCGDGSPNCEIDSGRFAVELKTNLPSPLRMSPAASLEFVPPTNGLPPVPETVTLFNDPNDPNARTINFSGTIVKGNFTEFDDCGTSLAPGASCTIQVLWNQKTTAFEQGSIKITYNHAQENQMIYLRGYGQ